MTGFTPKPGDIYLTRFSGPLGPVIEAGQALAALAPSRYSHAGIVGRDGEVIEAQGRGVVKSDLSRILAKRPLAFCPVPEWARDRRGAIVDAAESLIGTPYGFAAYPYIGLARLGIRLKWLERQLESTLICSAFADRAWELAGVALFDDGRLRGAVTPGHLAHVGWTFHSHTGPYRATV